MRQRNLAVLILQNVGIRALQDSWRSTPEARRMIAQSSAASARLHADQPAFFLQYLLLHLDADHALKVAYHGRIRMRPQRAAQQIISRPDVGHPVPHGLADGVLQRLGPRRDPAHFSAKKAHPQHVQLLALHVHVAHVDHALKAQQRAHCSCSHAVLPRPSFSNNALFAHSLG